MDCWALEFVLWLYDSRIVPPSIPKFNIVKIRIHSAKCEKDQAHARISVLDNQMHRVINPSRDGTATFYGLPAGSLPIAVYVGGRKVQTATSEIKSSGEFEIDLTLESAEGSIVGVTREDIQKLCSDLRAAFADGRFDGFSRLLSYKNKRIGPIDNVAYNSFLSSSPSLTGDDKALLEIVRNTINAKDQTYYIEYSKRTDVLSKIGEESAAKALPPGINVEATKTVYGGLPVFMFDDLMGSVTVDRGKGAYSLVVEDSKRGSGSDYFSKSAQTYVSNPIGREGTALHELFGHGRSLSLGRGASHQDEDAVRFENLVLRCMGHEDIQRDGTDHGASGKKLENATALPEYR